MHPRFKRTAHRSDGLGVDAGPAGGAGLEHQLTGHAVHGRVVQPGVAAVGGQPLGLAVKVGHLDGGGQRFGRPAGTRFDQRQTLPCRAAQAEPLDRRLQRGQGLQQRQRGFHRRAAVGEGLRAGGGRGLGRQRGHPLPGPAGAQVAQLFGGFQRRAGVVALQRFFVPADGRVDLAGLGAGQAKSLGHRAHAAPQRAEARFQKANLGQLPIGRRVLPPGLHGQLFQRQRQAQRRRDTGVLVEGVGARDLRVFHLGVEGPVRVAITLVGGPGVAAQPPGGLARRAHRVDERRAGQQLFVEGGGKARRRVVVHRPAGGDDAAHADADQRLGHTGGKLGAVEVAQHVARLACRQVAAVDEHQLGHGAHGLDLARAQKGAARHHHAAGSTRFAVAGDVHDAVAPRQQRVDDGGGVVVVDQLDDARRRDAAGLHQLVGHRLGLGQRAGQRAVQLAVDPRLADHQHGVVGNRILHALAVAVFVQLQLAQQLAAHGPGPVVAAVALVFGGVQQFPGDAGGAGVQRQHHAAGARQKRLQLGRHQQLKERAADLRVLVGVFRRLRHQLAQQRALRGLRAHLGAGAPGVQRVGDGAVAGLGRGGGDQVVVGAAVAVVDLPAQRPGAGLHGGGDLEAVAAQAGQQLQAAPGVGRALQVQLHQHQVADTRPAGADQPFVGLAHALGNGARRPARRDADAAAAHQRGGQLEVRRRAVRLFGHPLCPAEHALAHAARQVLLAQLALFTQADDDGALRRRHPPGVVGNARAVDKHLVRARGVRVQAGGERCAHRATDQAVDHALCAGQRQ